MVARKQMAAEKHMPASLPSSLQSPPQHHTLNCCDIFCRVVDNFGDIGVCWRLAQQLAKDYAPLQVRLLVDDLHTFARLEPTLNCTLPQQNLRGIQIQQWHADTHITPAADLVIEGFACRPPESYLQQMAVRTPTPVWLNLEYLSAENWVDDCHKQASLHPRLPLTQYFFFPGFSARSGGLLREPNLLTDTLSLQRSALAQQALWTILGLAHAIPPQALKVSLFAYENLVALDLLQALTTGPGHTWVLVPEGRILTVLADTFGQPLQAGDRLQQGNMTLQVLPFLSPAQYDQLLQASDLNCVRGEDSLVRAIWAGKPLLWQIYPQDEQAHLPKLQAYCQQMQASTGPQPLWETAMLAWSGAGSVDWPAFLSALPALTPSSQRWCEQLASRPDLAAQIMAFANMTQLKD